MPGPIDKTVPVQVGLNAYNKPAVELKHVADEDPAMYGEAMAALPEKKQRFVLELLENPNPVRAAVASGYAPSTGPRLQREPAIIAAIREEGDAILRSSAILGAQVLVELAKEAKNEGVRFKAASALLDRAGLLIEHKQTIEVKHTISDQEKIDEVRVLAKQLGLDATKLLGHAGVVVDAEFKDVTADAYEDEWTVGPTTA